MKKRFAIILIFLIALNFINVNALGISSYYYSKKPLIMAPGESNEVVFGKFQNMVGDHDITIRIELLEGEEIAEILDSSLDYFVPLGREDIPINMKVSIPRKSVEGEEYTITIRYYELNPPVEIGTVGLSAASQKTVRVLIQKPIKKPLKEMIWIFLIILIILILIVIIIIYFVKGKKFFSRVRKKKVY